MISIVSIAQPIDWSKKLPNDQSTLMGKLPNGITYYLRHNEEPKERASFYIIRDAGALLENDEQDGLAHFLEHMAFNGTKNFPGNTLISTLERHGISFGGNLNAYTSLNETVYNISDVPVTTPGLIDTCLLVLHDWSYYLTLDPKEIDEERGVITEEWRTRNSAGSRIFKQKAPILYKGSMLAKRDVIGNMDVIKSFKPETIRDFYHKWYRTDLEAICVVGDFDVKEMEQKIIKLFSSIPAIENPTPRPFIEIPDHEETRFVLATDKEATSSHIELLRIFRAPEFDGKGYATYADMKTNLCISFFNNMVSDRISEKIQRGEAPYTSASVSISSITRGYCAYGINATAKPHQEKEALIGVIQDNERALQHGFTQGELGRLKANTLTSLESMLKDKDKISNDSHAQDIKNSFLKNEANISIEDYVAAAKEIIPAITTEDVIEVARKYWKKDNRTIMISGPSEGETHLTQAEAMDIIQNHEGKPVDAYEDQSIQGNLINTELKGAQVVKEKELKQFDATEWTLSNGAKVVYRHADYEKDNVVLKAISKGGSSLYNDFNLLPAAGNTGQFASNYGLGQYDNISLSKLLTGKKAGASVSISNLYETVNGGSTPGDFETMMQLIYMRFMEPRFDAVVHQSLIERNLIYAKQVKNQPRNIISDSIQRITSNYHPRVQLFGEDYVNNITLERVEKVYRDRISDASDFIFYIVGNVDKDTVKEMACKYIGSIASSYRHEKWVDNKVRGPQGKVEKIISIPLEVPKSTVILSFRNEMKYNIKDSYLIDILGKILTTRYTKTIREDEGGTYGVGVSGSARKEPYNLYQMAMSFECNPDKAASLKPLLYVEVDKVIKDGVTEEELSKITLNMLKEIEQGKQHNSYWMSVLETYYQAGINMNDPKNVEDIIKNVKTKDVQKFAKRFFKNANIIDLTFSPAEK